MAMTTTTAMRGERVVPTLAMLNGDGFRMDGGARTWTMRASNFVVLLSEATPAATLERADNHDEYFTYFYDVGGTVSTDDDSMEVEPGTLVIVPPGRSTVKLAQEGRIVRVLSARATDLMPLSVNLAAYAGGTGFAAPLSEWPEPVGGYRLRAYRVADHATSPDTPMRLFRTRNLMVNVFPRSRAPRDLSRLTPHSHEDFDQGSLALEGEWIHHLRYPWGAEFSEWHADEHREVGSPSLMVIPPPLIHTSRNTSAQAQLVDIFAPPRRDFSERPGWVRNADEYPSPVV